MCSDWHICSKYCKYFVSSRDFQYFSATSTFFWRRSDLERSWCGRARNAGRSAQDPRTTPGWLPRVRLHSPGPTETESVVCRPYDHGIVNGPVRTLETMVGRPIFGRPRDVIGARSHPSSPKHTRGVLRASLRRSWGRGNTQGMGIVPPMPAIAPCFTFRWIFQ